MGERRKYQALCGLCGWRVDTNSAEERLLAIEAHIFGVRYSLTSSPSRRGPLLIADEMGLSLPELARIAVSHWTVCDNTAVSEEPHGHSDS